MKGLAPVLDRRVHGWNLLDGSPESVDMSGSLPSGGISESTFHSPLAGGTKNVHKEEGRESQEPVTPPAKKNVHKEKGRESQEPVTPPAGKNVHKEKGRESQEPVTPPAKVCYRGRSALRCPALPTPLSRGSPLTTA